MGEGALLVSDFEGQQVGRGACSGMNITEGVVWSIRGINSIGGGHTYEHGLGGPGTVCCFFGLVHQFDGL